MTKVIKFNPNSQLASLAVPPPKPASSYLPTWLKDMPSFHSKHPEFCSETGQANNTTVKKCVPFFDSFQMGYIQETWQDIWIETVDGEITFYHPTHPAIMTCRGVSASEHFPRIEGFLPNHFTWLPCWWPELPAGYSCLFTHPLNHDELPFRTFNAVVDCDSFKMCYHGSAMPFVLKENFSGMIKKGTPMYQMIPFKRESWESDVNPFDGDKLITLVNKVKQHFWDGYKKLHWTKKDFK